VRCDHDPRDFYVHRCGTGTLNPRSGVHALVIGTSQYRYLHSGNSLCEKLPDIPGAAFGAGNFAKFLRDKYRVRIYDEVPAGDSAALSLDTDGFLGGLADHKILTNETRALLPRTSSGDLPPGRFGIRSVTVDIGRGLRRLAPVAASLVPRGAMLQGVDSGVMVSGSRPVSLAAKIASRKTLPRFMMIPYVGSATNESRIVPVTPVGASTRLRVEPGDPVATLLMDYLIAGKFALACAAARAIRNSVPTRIPPSGPSRPAASCSSGTPMRSAATWNVWNDGPAAPMLQAASAQTALSSPLRRPVCDALRPDRPGSSPRRRERREHALDSDIQESYGGACRISGQVHDLSDPQLAGRHLEPAVFLNT
jgi:hypothetical protein